MIEKNKKVCFAASSGGHFEQLMMLEPIMDNYDSFIVTEKTMYSANYDDKKSYYLLQVNREEKLFVFKIIANLYKSLIIFLKEKPDVIICTGVLAVVPLCLICKLFNKKLIYIESFAKVTSSTLSGKLLYKYADQFYVQWKQMKKIYPNAIYVGGIY